MVLQGASKAFGVDVLRFLPILPVMQLSRFLSALAFSAAAVSAKRSLRHIGPAAERLEAIDARRLQAEPRITNEYVPTVKRASSGSYQYLTNKTQSMPSQTITDRNE